MAKYQWTRLIDEKEFEDLVNELCCKKYDLENFQLYGRKGQKQHGIDGFVMTKEKNLILHQCKNKMISRSDSDIRKELLKDIEQETASMVQEFVLDKKYNVETFIFANSFKQDTQLQNRAMELSVKHSFDIVIWSWDEISAMLEEYGDVAQKYYPNFFRDKVAISHLSHEETFLDDIFASIQREEPVMLLSMTSTSSHNRVVKYYKEKIGKLAIERYSTASFYSIHPPQKKDIGEEKYFSTLAKQCNFKENISDSLDFIERLQQQLELQDVFLLISDFENGSDRYREELASEIRALLDNSYSYEYSFYIVIFGRKKMARLKYEENQQGISPLNIFEDFLVPIPTVKDYQYIENTKSDISDIYTLTGGHPELIKLCLRAKTENYEELLISNSERFFKNYRYKRERVLKLFNQEHFGNYSIWSMDELLCDLFWDNLIVQDGSKFRWIAPVVVEMGKRYFR